jgi:hypothetical protein
MAAIERACIQKGLRIGEVVRGDSTNRRKSVQAKVPKSAQ